MKPLVIIFIQITLTVNLIASDKNFRYQKKNQEFGFHFGTVNYLGDLAHKGSLPVFNELNPKAYRFAAGVFYRYNFTKFTSLRTSFNIGQLYGNDAETNGDIHRINRNLHFQSIIIDLNVILEWNLLPYYAGDLKRFMTPFFGIGIGGFYYNPSTSYNGERVFLQSIGTEGQGILPGTKKYSLFNYTIPLIFGLKINVTRKLTIGAEIQYKKTFTDYIDDVSSASYLNEEIFYNNLSPSAAELASNLAYRAIDTNLSPRSSDQRGNPNNSDNYFFALMSFSYNFNKPIRYSCYYKGKF